MLLNLIDIIDWLILINYNKVFINIRIDISIFFFIYQKKYWNSFKNPIIFLIIFPSLVWIFLIILWFCYSSKWYLIQGIWALICSQNSSINSFLNRFFVILTSLDDKYLYFLSSIIWFFASFSKNRQCFFNGKQCSRARVRRRWIDISFNRKEIILHKKWWSSWQVCVNKERARQINWKTCDCPCKFVLQSSRNRYPTFYDFSKIFWKIFLSFIKTSV